MTHPAKYNKKFIEIFSNLLTGCKIILDPFSGTGKIKELEKHGFDTIGIEIEPDWATSILGDSTMMPIKSQSIDAICTSPTYGNRMADSFTDNHPEKAYIRNTYHHHLKRKPSLNNTGGLHFGERYLHLHKIIYSECARVIKPGGKFIINTKNFIHSAIETDVTQSHLNLLHDLDFVLISQQNIPTSGLTFGANRSRVKYETISELRQAGEP